MAYAALASLVQTIKLILNYHQASVSPGFVNQITSIRRSADSLLEFLEGSPDKASRFEGRITEVSNFAEDIIEFLLSQQIHESSGSEFKRQPQGKHRSIRYDFHELKKVAKKIESVIEEEVPGKHKDAVIGLEEDLVAIKDLLCGGPSRLEVISIFGMGGIGKTTLARNAYDHPFVEFYFGVRAWVTISQDYDMQRIISSLLVSMGYPTTGDDDDNRERVYKSLYRRRYLVVLDDIWSTEAWDYLKMMFPDNCNGSRIILTTRNCTVANDCGYPSSIHHLGLMNNDESWYLLRQKVFKGDICPPELESIGKSIVLRCNGMALAITVVSGILAAAHLTKDAWQDVLENINSLIKHDESFLEMLSLSYTYLPHHLRPCFLYLGSFPEDCEMRTSKLVKLWAAEGFLEPNGSKSFEEIGGEYLEDLSKRNLVLVAERKYNGRIKSFRVHDLIRDMCGRIATKENFFKYVGKYDHFRSEYKNCSRRIITDHFWGKIRYSLDHASPIRTILCLKSGERSGTRYCYASFRLLRILHQSDILLRYPFSLPDELFELFHLRYLAFDNSFDGRSLQIPAAISNFRNLQTLIISPSKHHGFYVELPVEIWIMPQLRHLVVGRCRLPDQQGGVPPLENLQTLSMPVNLVCWESNLKMIPNVKKLQISYEGSGVPREDYYQLYNLINLQRLEDLKIEMYNYLENQLRPAFPETLKKLTLSDLRLAWEDMEIVGLLPNLEVLKLRDHAFKGYTWETTEGKFSHLKFLLIDGSDLVQWITESSHFPILKRLILHRCWCLMEISGDIGDLPTLELIEVDDSNEDLLEWAKWVQKDQTDYGNDVLQVRCIKC